MLTWTMLVADRAGWIIFNTFIAFETFFIASFFYVIRLEWCLMQAVQKMLYIVIQEKQRNFLFLLSLTGH